MNTKLIKRLFDDICLDTIAWFRTAARWFVYGAMAYLIGQFTMDWMGFIGIKYGDSINNHEQLGRTIAWAFTLIYLIVKLPAVYRKEKSK